MGKLNLCQPGFRVFHKQSGEDLPSAMSRKSEGETKPTKSSRGRTARTASGSDIPIPSSGSDETLDQLGELPHSYGADTIFLVAQEPHWLFTYWDIDISRHPGGRTFLRVYLGPETIESEIEVPFETRNWYIPVKAAGSKYTVEIGYYRGSVWRVIARSVTIQTPADRISDSNQFDFATIPFHLSFQKVMENVQFAMREGESPVQALGRLQKEGRLDTLGSGFSADPALSQRRLLEALLGHELVEELSSGSFSSAEIETRIRRHLEEKLGSEGASELLGKGAFTPGESSLFSALSVLAGAAGASSWNTAELSSWAAAAFSSWTETASRWAGPAVSSGIQAARSSWEQGTVTSWNAAALSSWSSFAASSWGGASETIGSFGAPREFFLHVNAEVIFYGGTDPRAKVTIDGKPVQLHPDGTFRHHFIFPDGAYEIPIVATSPDGVETRGAILRFSRGTEKQGTVTDTVQPPLDAPVGART